MELVQLDVWNGSKVKTVSCSSNDSCLSKNVDVDVVNGRNYVLYKFKSFRDAACLYQPVGHPEFDHVNEYNTHLFYDQAKAIIFVS